MKQAIYNPAKVYQHEFKPQSITVVYSFKDSKMGFNNSITVEAISNEQAIEKAALSVAQVYGTGMLKKFTFKIK